MRSPYGWLQCASDEELPMVILEKKARRLKSEPLRNEDMRAREPKHYNLVRGLFYGV
jgi:hypothetical protein